MTTKLLDVVVFEEQGLRQRPQIFFELAGQLQRQDRVESVGGERRGDVESRLGHAQHPGHELPQVTVDPGRQPSCVLGRSRPRRDLVGAGAGQAVADRLGVAVSHHHSGRIGRDGSMQHVDAHRRGHRDQAETIAQRVADLGRRSHSALGPQWPGDRHQPRRRLRSGGGERIDVGVGRRVVGLPRVARASDERREHHEEVEIEVAGDPLECGGPLDLGGQDPGEGARVLGPHPPIGGDARAVHHPVDASFEQNSQPLFVADIDRAVLHVGPGSSQRLERSPTALVEPGPTGQQQRDPIRAAQDVAGHVQSQPAQTSRHQIPTALFPGPGPARLGQRQGFEPGDEPVPSDVAHVLGPANSRLRVEHPSQLGRRDLGPELQQLGRQPGLFESGGREQPVEPRAPGLSGDHHLDERGCGPLAPHRVLKPGEQAGGRDREPHPLQAVEFHEPDPWRRRLALGRQPVGGHEAAQHDHPILGLDGRSVGGWCRLDEPAIRKRHQPDRRTGGSGERAQAQTPKRDHHRAVGTTQIDVEFRHPAPRRAAMNPRLHRGRTVALDVDASHRERECQPNVGLIQQREPGL